MSHSLVPSKKLVGCENVTQNEPNRISLLVQPAAINHFFVEALVPWLSEGDVVFQSCVLHPSLLWHVSDFPHRVVLASHSMHLAQHG